MKKLVSEVRPKVPGQILHDRADDILLIGASVERYKRALVYAIRNSHVLREDLKPGIEDFVYIDDAMWIVVDFTPEYTFWHQLARHEWRWLD